MMSRLVTSRLIWTCTDYFLRGNEETPDFESLTSAELNQMLTTFYTTSVIPISKLRNYPREVALYLGAAPHYRLLDIVSDPDFESSNKIVTQRCGDIQNQQSMETEYRRKKPMTQDDLNKLYESGVLSNDNPKALQNKVWVELMIYIGGLARQDLRNLEKDHFVFEKDEENGKLYYRLDAKTMPESKKQIRVYEQPENLNCPVQSLWLYLSKLNPKSPVFFQQPVPEKVTQEDAIWFSHRPIGKNAHSTWLATICKEAGISTEYRNQALYCRTSTPVKMEPK